MGKAGTKNLDFMMLAMGILKRNASSSVMKSEHLPLKSVYLWKVIVSLGDSVSVSVNQRYYPLPSLL